LAAFFVRAAFSALTTLATLAHVAFMILAALLIASRLVVLLITAWCLLAAALLSAALLSLVATLLSEILVFIVCHIYSSRMFVIEISCAWNKSAARV
jgi:hypothetical protein